MQPKLVATLNTKATTIEEVARELAIAISTALDGDGDGTILLGAASAMMDDGRTLGLTLMLARPPGPVLAMQILPTFALNIAAGERERFRDAIVEALCTSRRRRNPTGRLFFGRIQDSAAKKHIKKCRAALDFARDKLCSTLCYQRCRSRLHRLP